MLNGKRSGRITTHFGYCEWAFEKDYVHIYNLFVLPKYRRKGKAEKILRQVISKIRTRYTGPISIVADPADRAIAEKLASFYMRMGLEVYSYYG